MGYYIKPNYRLDRDELLEEAANALYKEMVEEENYYKLLEVLLADEVEIDGTLYTMEDYIEEEECSEDDDISQKE
jgi:hypothetical protein